MDDLRKALFRALQKSDVNMLRAILAQGVALDFVHGDPKPVFLEAIDSDRNAIDILDLLRAAGADPKVSWPQDGATALHWSVSRDKPDVLNWFLAHGLDVNAQNARGETPLMIAIATTDWNDTPGQLESVRDVRILLAAGADVNLADNIGETALHKAAARGLDVIVTLLLDRGAVVDATNAIGETPLMPAAHAGKVETVRILLLRGADPRAQGEGGLGAIHDLAALEPEQMTAAHIDIAVGLLAAGADANQADDDGRTPVCWAATGNNAEMLRLLLRHDADPDALGAYALREATFFEYDSVVDALLAAGAATHLLPADCDGDWGDVPLLIAAHEDYLHGIEALLDRGADIEVATVDGETALLIAARRGHGEAVERLLQLGAHREHVDRYGNTALSWAQRNEDGVMAGLLKPQ